MKKMFISLSLLVTNFSVFGMDRTGGSSSATAPQQQKMLVTLDSQHIPISGAVFEELRAGILLDFLLLSLPQESQPAKRFRESKLAKCLLTFKLGQLNITGMQPWPDLDTADTHNLWHDLATAWDELTLKDPNFPIQTTARAIEILFTLAHNSESFQRVWAELSIAQQIQLLYDASDIFILYSPLRIAIINATAHIISAIGQLSKDEFLTLLPQLRMVAFRCLPARCALAHQLAFTGIQPHVTTLSTAGPAWFFNVAPNGTSAYITYDADNRRLYLYNQTTGNSTLIGDHVYQFTFAPDGTLAYTTYDTDNRRLYLYNQITGDSTLIGDHVYQFTFAPDGTLAYTTDDTDNRRLYLYNQTTGYSTLVRDHVYNCTFAPDGTLAYITDDTDNRRLYLYNQTTGTPTPIRDHVYQFTFAPDGTLAYITDYTDHHRLYLYNQTTGYSPLVRDHVYNCTFAPDGTLAYTTIDETYNRRLYLYNQTNKTSALIRDHVGSFTFAPDGTLAYAASWQLYFYNQTTGTTTLIRDRVHQFTFAPDGTLFLNTDDGHLLHYNFTLALDTIQQLILLFVLSHDHAGHPCSFTASEMAALERQFYVIPDVPPLVTEQPALLKEECPRITAEQRRTILGLRNSLLDMPEELRTHIHISGAGAGAGGAGPA